MAFGRSRRAEPPADLTASLRLSVSDPNEFLRHRDKGLLGLQDKAWSYYDKIGEIHSPLNHAAKEVGKAKLIAQRYDAKPVENVMVQDLVDALCSRVGGQAGLLRAYYLNRKVVGEGYLLGYEEASEPYFDFVSPDELLVDGMTGGMGERRDRIQRRTRPGSQSIMGQDIVEDLPPGTVIIRIWNPHPRYSDIADGPLVAMNEICEELIILTASLKAKIQSRLAMAGILFLPNGLTAVNAPQPPSGDPTGLVEDETVDKIIRSWTRGIQNPGDAEAIMPMVIRGPGDQGDLIRWITMDREIFKVDIEQRQELIGRIQAGLDLQTEVQTGLGDANHWGAWTIQDVHVNVEIGTEVESFCAAVTKDYLWPALIAEGMARDEAREYKVGSDLSGLTSRPNMAEDARQMSDRGALSPESLRKYGGASDEDAPTGSEYVRWVGTKVNSPVLALFDTPEYDEIDWDLVVEVAGKAKPGPNADNPGEDPSVGPGVGQPGSPGGGDSDAPKADRPDGG